MPTQTKPKPKPKPSPAELRAALGLPADATDKQVREVQKVERFKHVAARRTNAARDAMLNLSRTANRANYTYTPDQVETILAALQDAYTKVHDAFNAQQAERTKITL